MLDEEFDALVRAIAEAIRPEVSRILADRDSLRAALKRIATEDYRGSEPAARAFARQALTSSEKEKEKA